MTPIVPDPWTFLALTLILGGAGAFVAGRAMALSWRSRALAVGYMIPMAAGVRFLHYALFQEPTGAAQALVCFAILAAFVMVGFELARRRQMRVQYPWLH